MFEKIFETMTSVLFLDGTLPILQEISALHQQILRREETFLIDGFRLGGFELGLLHCAEVTLFEIVLLQTEPMLGQRLSLLIVALSELDIFELLDGVGHGWLVLGFVEVLVKNALLLILLLVLP